MLKLLLALALIVTLGSGCGSKDGSQGGDGGNGGVLLTLGSPVQYATNNVRTSKIAVGDLNGDGLNDVAAIGDVGGEQHILIYYQGRDHKFTLVVDVPSPDFFLRGLAIGDINNDKRDDLVLSAAAKNASAGAAGRIIIYYQDPAKSSLQTPQISAVSSTDVGELCISDLNSDGLKDIAVLGSPASGVKGNISIFYQKPDGSLDQEFIYGESSVRPDGKIRAADMDNDGHNDLVFQSGDLEFTVVKQAAAGTLSTTPDVYSITGGSASSFHAFAAGDANHDGKNDVVVVTPGTTGSLYLFLQNAAGKLDPPVQIDLLQNAPDEIELADVNGDGRNDILGDVVNAGGNVRVYFQGADRSFNALNYDSFIFSSFIFSASKVEASLSLPSLAVGDVTGDGLRDVVIGWPGEGLFVLPGTAQESAGKTLSISGTVMSGDAPLVGAAISLRGTSNRSTTTDSSGNYKFTAIGNGNYTVSPSKTGYSFSPATRSVTVDGSNVTGQDFAGTTFSISGTVTSGGAPLPGVNMILSGTQSKTILTDSNGNYTFTGLGNGNYTVSPSRINYSFSPVNRPVAINGSSVPGQNFAGTTFSISGTVTAGGVALAGVTMSLSGTQSKTTTTNSSGNYTFTTLGNGNYTVSPSKISYSFSPVNRPVAINGSSVTGQNFAGTTFSISGTVTAGGFPLAGATISLSGSQSRTATTDANGNYTLNTVGNGNYTITPSRTGYSFSPVNRSVTINGLNITGQDFTGTTFTISGTVTAGGFPLAGATISLSGPQSKITTTDANGNYTLNTVGNGNYTITPSRTGYSFSPLNSSVTISGSSITGQDFTGTTSTISGTVTTGGGPLAGVTILLSGSQSKITTTDANGNYTLNTVGNGNYTIAASRIGYSFSPASRSVTISGSSITGQDFTGTTSTISGTVTTGGGPLAGVTILLSGPQSKITTTDASGNYTFNTVGNGSYTITPSKTAYIFSPTNRAVSVSGSNVTGQDFTGTTFSISGTVLTSGGSPLGGVNMLLSGTQSKSTTTNASGNYTFNTVGNGSYTITPSKPGYSFSPASSPVTVNGSNVTGQVFTSN